MQSTRFRTGKRAACRFFAVCTAWLCVFGPAFAAEAETEVVCFGRFELALPGDTTGIADPRPQEDWEVTVERFAPDGSRSTVPACWDGQDRWRVRFMPDMPGRWRWRLKSVPAVKGIDGLSGGFVCRRSVPVPTERPEETRAKRFLRHGPLEVDPESRTFLTHRDGTPFLWLADTAWCGPALATDADWKTYLADRAAKKFTAVQFNVVSPWRTAPTDADGRTALTGTPRRIDPAYFARLDRFFEANAEAGLLSVPVILWAHKAGDAGVDLPQDECLKLARYIVNRYRAYPVVWILAGDARYTAVDAPRWKTIGKALFGAGTGPHAPVMTHPTGMNWPWADWHEETWLDVLGYQSGHGDSAATLKWLQSGPPTVRDERAPVRPILNLEPPYEDHLAYQSKKPLTAEAVRKAAWWSVLNAPTAGVSYGAHGIWSWETEPGKTPRDHAGSGTAKPWREALALPGSTHMQHLATALESVRWRKLRPAQHLLREPASQDDPAKFVAVAAAADLLVAYLPAGGEILLDLGRFETPDADARPTSVWFDPRTGERRPARPDFKHLDRFVAPDDRDWVLIIGN